ncbi:MAG TPA: FAD-dependent oxidoreductase [Mycobacteriales bacterium]|nr:FAD-dependent oxidoreductase [Mycobacteriales bacterium]
MRWYETDVLVVGGGLGGVAAALAALRLGRRVVLTEESSWLGGQLTSQAVPPDEHPWIEDSGCSRSYRELRNGIRDYYRRHYPLTADAAAAALLNPGNGSVSRLCHEPRVAVAVIEEMLAPYRGDLRLQVLMRHEPRAAQADGDTVATVSFVDTEAGDDVAVNASYVLDATELGDLLDLAGVEHVVGTESRSETGEPHAPEGPAQPLDQQAFTWCFAVDYFPEADHTIERPADYDFWRSYRPDFWPGNLLSWQDVSPTTLKHRDQPIFADPGSARGVRAGDRWTYRRILTTANHEPGRYASDISLVNWPQNDYWLGPLIGVDRAEADRHLSASRQLALSFLYWMQTEAPRLDGGTGYRGLRPRGDVLGTHDGLAMRPYIRESRRIRSEFTVLEQHVGVQSRSDAGLPAGSAIFHDSVGIGSYRIDLHPSTGGPAGPRTYVDIPSYPFQIPLGSLIPQRVDNLLPANKNLGTTHISNGCYRLHPVEWNIGEAAGALAAHCLQIGATPRKVRNDRALLADFQDLLQGTLGFQLGWPDSIRATPR